MQPLDYMFEIIILSGLIYGMFYFWNRFLRVRRSTKDDLMDRYIKLERVYGSRR